MLVWRVCERDEVFELEGPGLDEWFPILGGYKDIFRMKEVKRDLVRLNSRFISNLN